MNTYKQIPVFRKYNDQKELVKVIYPAHYNMTKSKHQQKYRHIMNDILKQSLIIEQRTKYMRLATAFICDKYNGSWQKENFKIEADEDEDETEFNVEINTYKDKIGFHIKILTDAEKKPFLKYRLIDSLSHINPYFIKFVMRDEILPWADEDEDEVSDFVDTTENCPICFDPIDEICSVLTRCGHKYCCGCAKQIKKQYGTCSVCRKSIEPPVNPREPWDDTIDLIYDTGEEDEVLEQLDRILTDYNKYDELLDILISTDGFAHSVGYETEQDIGDLTIIAYEDYSENKLINPYYIGLN